MIDNEQNKEHDLFMEEVSRLSDEICLIFEGKSTRIVDWTLNEIKGRVFQSSFFYEKEKEE